MDYTFNIGPAIERGVRIWLRNFVPFTLLTALAYAPMAIATYAVTHGDHDRATVKLYGSLLGMMVAFLNILLTAMLTYGVVMDLRGRPAGLLHCVGVGLRRFLPALGVALLVLLATVGGTILFIVPGLMATCAFYVAVPAAIVEKPGLFGALGRSRVLTRGYRWHILGLTLLVGMIPAIVGIVVRFSILGLDDRHASLGQWTDYLYAQTGLSVLFGPLGAVFPAVTYYLLRQDKESASVSDLVSVFE